MVQNEKRQRRNLRLGGVVVGVGGLQRSGVGFAFSSLCKCVFVWCVGRKIPSGSTPTQQKPHKKWH